MRVLVTGAAGFIGSHVARALLTAGHSVRAVHLPTDDLRNLDDLDAERIAADVRDPDAMRAAARGCEWVFHLAAVYSLSPKDAELMWSVNVEGTRNVLAAARGARTIMTSSIARFGGQGRGRRATERSPFRLGHTGDVYSQTKAVAHEIALEAARAQDVVIVAPTGPIGPGDVRPTPTGRLLLFASRMPAAIVMRTASNFADVRDMARGHVLAAEKGRSGEAYLLGDVDLEIAELARMAQRLRGRTPRVLTVPRAIARLGAHAAMLSKRPLVTPAAIAIANVELRADCAKARDELGLVCGPIERAMEDALDWFDRNRRLSRAS